MAYSQLSNFIREPASENLGWEISAPLTTQRAGVDDPATGHGFYGSSDIFATTLTGDNKVANTGNRSLEHVSIIGEEKTKMHYTF
jgi:hypothetical protein